MSDAPRKPQPIDPLIMGVIDRLAEGTDGDPVAAARRRLELIADLRSGMPRLVSDVGMRARGAGLTWGEIAAALGYRTPGGAQGAVDPDLKALKIATSRTRDRAVPAESAPGIGATEAARRLGVSLRTVYNMVERGELSALEHAGRLRIDPDSIQAG